MDIHPMLVHFPVALLSLYALMELFTFGKLRNRTFISIKTTFLLLGTLGSYAAFIAGTFAEDKYGLGVVRAIIEMHRMFATSVLVIFSVLALGYAVDLVSWLLKPEHDAGKGTWSFFNGYKRFILSAIPLKVLAFLGLCAITVTGALGGSIVYGPEVDPIAAFIYRMLL